MNTSSNNNIIILDLPNEILVIIFNKLNMIDAFYSLVDVNERFNRLVFDRLYIHNLDLTVKSSNRMSSINNQMLDKVCEKILPRIYHQVNKLTVEPYSIERLLFTTGYPQLDSLSLINFQKETFYKYLTGNTMLRFLLMDQIKHLVVEIKDETTTATGLSYKNTLDILSLILFSSKRLTHLIFSEWSSEEPLAISIFNHPTASCVSSTLTQLEIHIDTFDDCLYLLDGRFECLTTLIVNILKISISKSNIDNTKKLTKLKHFSLISICYTIFYEKQIIPLLHRMTNLEELTLLLSILSIVSQTVNKNIKIDLPSNDNIQSSFIERGYNQVGSYADFNSTTNVGRCHVFSLPYRFEIFINLNNFFTGGIFNKVRCLFMNDTSSFEHELFALVSQAFPYLEKLYVYNFQAQKNKQHSSTLIVFSHLVKLILSAVHVDYAEQFLFEKNTRLPRLLELTIEYETLAIVTNNFTNDAARLNCVNLQNIHIEGSFVRPESFHHYFPLLIGGCTFDRPLLGEFYSYENGLETHTSLKENGTVDRRSYRRESGAGATRKDGGDLLVTQDLGHCYQLTVRQNYYELIYRDEDKSCFQCYQMFNRTKNVIQIRKSSCGETTSLSTNQMNFDDLCRTIDEQNEFITLFSKSYSAEVC
ncbi:unnamed protein product [Rotaria socialis]|uniref:F-box domain-containing protein n=1 Tax=Rotaria socialis TaxID=392032 RepID=A0A817Z384_9BILA|nr:unnamed protein product [Rotaria socialis]